MWKLSCAAGLALAAVLALPAYAAPAPAYHVARTLKGGGDGGWDIATFDPVKRRIYIGRAYGVMFIDADTGAITSKLADGHTVHEVLPLPGGAMVMATDGGTNRARLIDTASGKVVAEIPTGKDPDAATYDPATHLALAMNPDSASATLVDIATHKGVGTISIPGDLEYATADGTGKVYVNANQDGRVHIAVVDVKARRVVATYPLTGCKRANGLDYIAADHLLFSACTGGTAKFIAAATGKQVASLPVCAGSDAAVYDPVRKRAFVPCGREGVMDVISLDDPAHPAVIQRVTTENGARTAAVDPKTGDVYLPVAKRLPTAVPGRRRRPIAPGTFHVLVIAP